MYSRPLFFSVHGVDFMQKVFPSSDRDFIHSPLHFHSFFFQLKKNGELKRGRDAINRSTRRERIRVGANGTTQTVNRTTELKNVCACPELSRAHAAKP